MATIKSFTDISQSKVLAEILPFESADMNYILEDFVDEDTGDIFTIEKVSLGHPSNTEIGCWSLAALLNIIPSCEIRITVENKWEVISLNDFKVVLKKGDNPIDACYEMILKLHELNLL